MRARYLAAIDEVPAAQWNRLELGGNPLLRHEFLSALENTGCANAAAGWIPQHVVLEDRGEIVGAMPLFEKDHSWGEFVFDWSWARAYAQAGLAYYPKLVSMIPFSPLTTGHLLVRADADGNSVREQLIRAAIERAQEKRCSSAHVLFPLEAEIPELRAAGFLLRHDCQFHWFNRDYRDFDHFIGTFRSEKRKKALRERRRIVEAGVRFRTLHGDELDADLWETVFAFSENTFQSRGHEHYLSAEFFVRISELLPRAVMVKLAMHADRPIAAAIFFRSDDALYGRYWGAEAEFHSLHFETCYYQGIEYCIEHGLQRFEPGTQGEHKVPRGFEPTYTWSAHWIADPRFRRAIDEYLNQERAAMDQYMASVREHVPFRRTSSTQAEEP